MENSDKTTITMTVILCITLLILFGYVFIYNMTALLK